MRYETMWPNGAFTEREIFACMYGESTMLQDVPEGTEIPVKKFVIYADEKDDGKVAQVLHIVDTAGVHYSTISSSVKKMILSFVDTVSDAEDGFTIKTRRGKTKANRDFLTVDIL